MIVVKEKEGGTSISNGDSIWKINEYIVEIIIIIIIIINAICKGENKLHK